MKDTHDEVVTCKCGSEDVDEITEKFRFSMTYRRDGTAIDPPVLGILSAAQCHKCGNQFALIDSTDDEEYWKALTPWPSEVPRA